MSEGVAAGRLSLERAVELVAGTPARLFGLPAKGAMEVGRDADLVLWKPGTRRVEGLSIDLLRMRAAMSATRRAKERIAYRAKAPGWYYVEAKLVQPGDGAYRLAFAKR